MISVHADERVVPQCWHTRFVPLSDLLVLDVRFVGVRLVGVRVFLLLSCWGEEADAEDNDEEEEDSSSFSILLSFISLSLASSDSTSGVVVDDAEEDEEDDEDNSTFISVLSVVPLSVLSVFSPVFCTCSELSVPCSEPSVPCSVLSVSVELCGSLVLSSTCVLCTFSVLGTSFSSFSANASNKFLRHWTAGEGARAGCCCC